jgi:hypothetical protein
MKWHDQMKENAERKMKAEMEKTGVILEQKAMYVRRLVALC